MAVNCLECIFRIAVGIFLDRIPHAVYCAGPRYPVTGLLVLCNSHFTGDVSGGVRRLIRCLDHITWVLGIQHNCRHETVATVLPPRRKSVGFGCEVE